MKLWHMNSKILRGFYASEVYAAGETQTDAIHVALLAYDRFVAEAHHEMGFNPINGIGRMDEDCEAIEAETRRQFHDELQTKLRPVPGRATILEAHLMPRSIEETLDDLEHIRNWLHEAPIEELEAVEKALQCNAPITAVSDVIADVWELSNGYVTREPASDAVSEKVLAAAGSLLWYLFRVPNGDLIFGCYPYGSLYEEIT